MKWTLSYHAFRGKWASWEELFSKASEFATQIGPERLVNISHSADHHDGLVVVWYWEAEGSKEERR